MRRAGWIVENVAGVLRVRLAPEACDHEDEWRPGAGCAACGGCARAAVAHGARDQTEDVLIPATPDKPRAVGDRVMVEVDDPNMAVMAALVFGLPLAGLIGGLALGMHSRDSEALVVLFTLGGLAAGFLLLWLINRCASGRLVKRTFTFADDTDALADDIRAVEHAHPPTDALPPPQD